MNQRERQHYDIGEVVRGLAVYSDVFALYPERNGKLLSSFNDGVKSVITCSE